MNTTRALQSLMKGPLSSLYYCIGNPVVGNPTEFMVEEAFRSLGYAGRYLTCEIEEQELEAVMWGLRAMHVAGLNVTAPFKQKVFPFLDELTESARLSNAVNCITRQSDGTYLGDNTDGKGFLQSLTDQLGSVKGRTVLIFGSGGAASAIATELVLAEAQEVVLLNRSEGRSQALAKRLDGFSSTKVTSSRWEGTYHIDEDNLVVVQATTVGLFDEMACIDVEFAKNLKHTLVCDVVFNPVDTAFLVRAREAGCQTLDGLGMLVNQGAIAIKGWTTSDPDRAVMHEALVKAFNV